MAFEAIQRQPPFVPLAGSSSAAFADSEVSLVLMTAKVLNREAVPWAFLV